MNKIPFFHIVLLISLLVFCSDNSYPVKQFLEDGTPVTKNPNYPKSQSQKYSIQEDLTIGVADGDSNYTFNYLYDIAVDTKNNIYVLDMMDYLVRVYDQHGKFLFSFGRKGQGPGEFVEPSSIYTDNNDNIFVCDVISDRITQFNPKGQYVSDFAIKLNQELIGIGEGQIFFLTNRNKWDTRTGKEERTFDYYNHIDKELYKIAALHGQNGTPRPEGGLMTTGYETGALNYIVNNNGELIVGNNEEYYLSVYDMKGKLLRKFGREIKNISITSSDKKRLFGSPVSLRENESLLPQNKPAFKISRFRFLCDQKDNIWIPTFEKEDEGIIFDIFDEKGIYITKIFLKYQSRDLKPLLIKHDYLYAIHYDDDRVNRVKRFKIVADL